MKLFVIAFFLLYSCYTMGQDGIFVKNNKTGEKWVFEKNSNITYVRFKDEDYSSGKLKEIKDTLLIIGHDTVAISTIAGIRKKAPGHTIARIIGMPFMIIGSLTMATGIANLFGNSDSETGIKLFISGAAIFTIGYLPYEISRKDLTVGFRGEWTIEPYTGNILQQ